MIDRNHDLPIIRQAKALNISRGSVYYKPRPVSAEDLALMRRIDELHLELPFYGSRRMTFELNKEGRAVNRKRVQRLMRVMGIEALVPRPGTSKPAPGHKIYPYLLRGLAIAEPNHVWAADITLYLIRVAGHSRSTRPGQLGHHLRRSVCDVDGAPGLTHAPWTRSDGSQGLLRDELE